MLAWVDGWSLTPIVNRQNGSAVTSILALRTPAGATGENITAVWYIRDAQDPTVWSGKAWSGASEWEAVKWVKDSIGIPDCFDDAWATFTPKVESEAPTAPEDYIKGFVASDPVLDLIESSPDRDALVEALASFGYKVADIPLDYKGGLGEGADRTNLLLSAIATGVQTQQGMAEAGVDHFSGAFESEFQASFSLSWFCYPISFTVPGTWSAWTPGAWGVVPCTGTSFCCYEMQVCRPRTIVEYTVTWSCAVGVSNPWQEQECWTHTGACPQLAQGPCPAVPGCSLANPQTPGNAPPPGTCATRRRR
jgi:hypothetical protein